MNIAAAAFLLLTLLAWHTDAIAAPLTLSWADNSVDETGFSVERSTGGAGVFAEIATTGAGVTTYVDPTVSDTTAYCYRLRAFNPAGYSGYSNTACFSPSDVTAPTVSITAPSGGNVSGNVTITASATDGVGVTMMKYYVDGALIGVFAPPVYSQVWNTALVPNGAHALTAKATDAAGNTGTSAPVTVTVANPNLVPVLATLSPSSAQQGGPAFTLTVTGSGFVQGSTVRWNGSNRTTTFGSATQLTAAIPATDIVNAGTPSITVFTPAPGGGTSGALTFTVTAVNPVPVLSTLAPNSGQQGGPAFTLTVTGSNFVPASVVQWNGSSRATTFGSGTQLTASIPASDLAAVGTAQVTVVTPAPGGGTSGAVSFAVTANPVPVLSTLVPSSAAQSGPAFTLTVTGGGFVPASNVRWNGSSRTTTFVSASQLTASIPAADIASAGTASITVFTPAPGGGTSGALVFTVTAVNPVPVLSTLAPNSALQGGPAVTLTVTGSGFVPASGVRWNGSSRTTTFVSASQLTASIPASDLAAAGTAQVTVVTPAPGGGTSGAASFTVTAVNPVPALSTLAPNSALQGGPAVTLTVTGSGFVPASGVRWNGSSRATTFVSANQLTAAIPASDLVTAGTSQVTVVTPAPGGGTSSALSFTVSAVNPVPGLSTLAPNSGQQGGQAFTLTVIGSNFVPTSVVQWNGGNRATTFVSANQLTATILATDIASLPGSTIKTRGAAKVTVFTPAPGGGISSAQSFTLTPANPEPKISTLSPSGGQQGDPAFTLTVNGDNFIPASVVQWNGSSRPTTFVSPTQLTANIPASDLATAGTGHVTVFTPGPGGGTSRDRLYPHPRLR